MSERRPMLTMVEKLTDLAAKGQYMTSDGLRTDPDGYVVLSDEDVERIARRVVALLARERGVRGVSDGT